MIKIWDERDRDTVEYKSVNPGEAFYRQGLFYIKTNKVYEVNNSKKTELLYALRLYDGSLNLIPEDEKVELVDLKIKAVKHIKPDIHESLVDTVELDLKTYPTWDNNIPSNIPEACRNCSTHPSNGGDGICHCTLGLPKITW